MILSTEVQSNKMRYEKNLFDLSRAQEMFRWELSHLKRKCHCL